MMKYIWAGMIVIGVAVGICTGKADAVGQAITDGAMEGAELCLSLMGIYCLWLGILNIADKAGLVNKMAKVVGRCIGFLFRGLKRDSDAMGYITLNMVANMLGMGNAATPFGLKAMEALNRENGGKKTPSAAMCMFIIINTASVQLLPLTIIGLRAAAGSQAPGEIIVTAFLATLATAIFGIIGAKLCERFSAK